MDECILRRAQTGDAAAFEQLITPYEPLVWRVCWHYTHHQEDARDCAQDAMVKAWRSLRQYRKDCSLESWLYRIAASCCVDFLRRKKHRATQSTDVLAEAGLDLTDPAPLPEERLLQREEAAQLYRALDSLPEDMRTVLILSCVEGCRYEDIAQTLGIATGTVKSRINRARKKLAETLAAQPTERRRT